MRHYVVVGIDNPYSDLQNHALFPYPPMSAGARFWRMTGLTRGQYIRVFDRHNLFLSYEKKRGIDQRRIAAKRVVEAVGAGYGDKIQILALGRMVADSFGLPIGAPLVWSHPDSSNRNLIVAYVPHPSGLNRWYNDKTNDYRARKFVETVALDAMRSSDVI